MSSLARLLQKLEYLFPDKFPVAQYRAFVQRGWWYRVWVIQEYCLAHEPVFVCGGKRVSLDHLSGSASFLHFYGWFKTRKIYNLSNPPEDEEERRAYEMAHLLTNNNAASVMFAFRSQYQRRLPNKDCTLYSLLQTTCVTSNAARFKATDERDKIFALLGLASDKDKLQIRVDYSEGWSTKDVYIDASRALLTRGHMELLSLRQIGKIHSTLPSWVCDWRLEVHLPYGDCTHVDRPFAASGNSASQISVDTAADGQHIASIQGLQVDKIEIVGSHQSDIVGTQPDSKWDAANVFVSETECLCGDCSTEDVATILLGGLEYYGIGHDSKTLPRSRRVTAKSQEGYNWMKTWLRLGVQLEHLNQQARQHGNTTSEIKAGYDEVSRSLQEVHEYWEEVSTFWSQMCTLLERRPFRSTKGYVGLAPANTEPGDMICLFFGSKLPHILRPVLPDRHQLIGEAYVHRIMDGELMAGAVSSTTFKLC